MSLEAFKQLAAKWRAAEKQWQAAPDDDIPGFCYRRFADELEAVIDKVPSPQFQCGARKTADPPQDCDWPFCGCDPYADNVIDAIEESGRFTVVASPPQACSNCGCEERDHRGILTCRCPDTPTAVASPPHREETNTKSEGRPQKGKFMLCAICRSSFSIDETEQHLRSAHVPPVEGFLFFYNGRSYRTQKPSMLVSELLCLVWGSVTSQFYEQRENKMIPFSQEQAVDLTKQPWFVSIPPATY